MMSYGFLERELEAVEDKMSTLDGECDELADDLQRAVELLRRCTCHLRPYRHMQGLRLDPVIEDVKAFLDTYDAARR